MKQHGDPGLTVHPCPLPGLGHEAALLKAHQLQSELEALRSLRAEEFEAAAGRQDQLRLPGQEPGLAPSVSEPHPQVSPMSAPGHRVVADMCAAARHRKATLPGGGSSGKTQGSMLGSRAKGRWASHFLLFSPPFLKVGLLEGLRACESRGARGLCNTCQCSGINALSSQADTWHGKWGAPLEGTGQALCSLFGSWHSEAHLWDNSGPLPMDLWLSLTPILALNLPPSYR